MAELTSDIRAAVREKYAALADVTDEMVEVARRRLVDIEIRETHRVHEHAGSAIIRARKP